MMGVLDALWLGMSLGLITIGWLSVVSAAFVAFVQLIKIACFAREWLKFLRKTLTGDPS